VFVCATSGESEREREEDLELDESDDPGVSDDLDECLSKIDDVERKEAVECGDSGDRPGVLLNRGAWSGLKELSSRLGSIASVVKEVESHRSSDSGEDCKGEED
jgi:hypothetical protein